MLNYEIKTVPDSEQRYNTVGDYYTTKEGKRAFIVSDMDNWKYEFLVAIHELVESALCKENRITDETIDAFDLKYEANRSENDITSEPGNDPTAPYFNEHQFATKLEKMVAAKLGVDWNNYSNTCSALTKK